ncbi:MAG: glutamate synthase large subunit [Victivallales bacterium]|nr:glutamate synthase large subunit [Victivallales bacterium]
MEQQSPDRQRRLGIPQDEGLYHFNNEHDACGVGLVANLSGASSHGIVSSGLTILRRLLHRGAAGGDALSGDGAGLLCKIPHEFFQRELGGILPPAERYGIGMLFDGVGQEPAIEAIVQEEGCCILAWREVPADSSQLGEQARASCPRIRQLFVSAASDMGECALERRIFVIRRRLEREVPGVYFPSFSTRTIIYKGLMLATQIEAFYSDLADEAFASPFALVHQRYSTNTFPTWQLAQPFRLLAHNGEINTLRGNLNHARTREPFLQSALFGEDLRKLLPLIDERQSDSACLDNMAELLVQSGRWLPHAMLMLIPQAWGSNYHVTRDIRGFFDYHSTLVEPWDGPAAVSFTDGIGCGAMLDRNGLRPARYSLTKGGLFVLASETGVLDLAPEEVVLRGRLKPGEILWCDLEAHRLVLDAELKNTIARQSPYRRWSQENKIPVAGMFDTIAAAKVPEDLRERQRFFGWTQEDLELIVRPMVENGHEPVGSMGNDAALAVLSPRPQLLFNYFKQRFAQVTNPPIDPIREELVMSLTTYIGNSGNILSEEAHRASVIRLARPVLTGGDLARLMVMQKPRVLVKTLGTGWREDLEGSLQVLEEQAVKSVKEGAGVLILSDRHLAAGELPIPSLLAVSAVNRALTMAGLRPPVGVIVESGEVREVMHYALLLGYGATAIHPYLALETVTSLAADGDAAKATENYITAVDKGLLKCMSKMGIATLRSYRSAQMFEALGLGEELVRRYFPGTPSAVGGIGLAEIASEVRMRCQAALAAAAERPLPVGGNYRWRSAGEPHLVTPLSVCALHHAVRENDVEQYRIFAKGINEPAAPIRLRDLLRFRGSTEALPLEEVESVESILHHFVGGAMSLGALSPEAHEAIAVAMNRIGCLSNSGEGGEGPERDLPNAQGECRASAIRQVASGRFGVTIDYLAHAKDLQIKMAQGAKPGEGGQLPGPKVNEEIARTRHSTPKVTLISPPPHHDIYSIEDLAQLIHDLKAANESARISVKLVAESGVGTVAAGVAKAHADVVVISGHDGGTGAAPLSSIKHTGMTWEIGLAEAHQTLVKNNLRGKVKLQVDGHLRTGRDVVIAALLGAEEFGFATSLLLSLGCLMLRQCQDNTCPAGITTQDPEIRKRFQGKPEHIINYLRFIAAETRAILAGLGLRSLDAAVGRTDLLEVNPDLATGKAAKLDFAPMLHRVTGEVVCWQGQKDPAATLDDEVLLPRIGEAVFSAGRPCELEVPIRNADRSVGARLSSRLVLAKGASGLPDDTWRVNFRGVAGQSFGAFLAHGITFRLEGEANDYVGKGLSGGKIIIVPDGRATCPAEQNVLAGNVIGYGGTSGVLFIGGQAGERFAIRNSGFTAVVEGVGDHGCEYMTGGRVVVLGKTGVNFAAGMTGGIAYVLDEDGDFDLRCNLDTVDLEPVRAGTTAEGELLELLERHAAATQSPKAMRILQSWDDYRGRFICVMPVEYREYLRREHS